VVILHKSFWYAGVIWLFRECGYRIWYTAGGFAGLLLLMEWMQRHLPNRSPEITDSVVTVLVAFILALLERHSRKAKSTPGNEA
jgi:hypothetical protein